MAELILGQIPEAIYFASFMILIKEFKTKRVLCTLLMLILYFGLANIFAYNLKFQFFYIFGSYGIMKLLYGKKVQITDLFLLVFGVMILCFYSIVCYFLIAMPTQSLLLGNFACKMFSFITLIFYRDKIREYYKKYYNNWNLKPGLKFRPLSVRNSSLLAFYLTLSVIGLWLTFRLMYLY